VVRYLFYTIGDLTYQSPLVASFAVINYTGAEHLMPKLYGCTT